MQFEEALAHVPPGARNREALARLLAVADDTLAAIKADKVQAEFYRRMYRAAALLGVVKESTDANSRSSANRAAHKALNAARMYATRNGLHPNSSADIRRDALLILETL